MVDFCVFLFFRKPQKFHFSMDNIQKSSSGKPIASLVTPFSASRSCESIYRSKGGKSPKLPIAQKTARIIERAKTTSDTGNDGKKNNTEVYV